MPKQKNPDPKRSAAARALWADPDYRAKQAEGVRRSDAERDEMIRKLSEKIKQNDLRKLI